jgi:hypothetical protein
VAALLAVVAPPTITTAAAVDDESIRRLASAAAGSRTGRPAAVTAAHASTPIFNSQFHMTYIYTYI